MAKTNAKTPHFRHCVNDPYLFMFTMGLYGPVNKVIAFHSTI